MNYKCKRGYSLIEVMITISISIILLTVSSSVIVNILKDNLIQYKQNVDFQNVDNCLINIKNILNEQNIESIETVNNQICVNLKNNKSNLKKRSINFNYNILRVQSYSINNDTLLSTNVLLKNVENFNVFKKGNLIYYRIKTLNGGDRVDCFAS